MTRLEKESLRRLLDDIATTIEGAEERSERSAKADIEARPSTCGHWPFQVGMLAAITREQARRIRAALDVYLAPKRNSAPATRRGVTP